MEPVAVVRGRWNRPELHLYFEYDQPHAAVPEKSLRDWVREYLVAECGGQAHWNKRGGYWQVLATGQNPERKLQLAGIRVDFSEVEGTDMRELISVNELVSPLTRISRDGSNALILPRLLGFERTRKALGSGARWEQEFKRFVIPVASAMSNGAPVPGIEWSPEIIHAAQLSLGRITTPQEISEAAAAAGAVKDPSEMDAADLARLIELVGDIPDWFGLELFPFQRIGAIAAAAGHRGIFDEPGLGKTRESLAAAAILGSKRTLITSLPVALTHWMREVDESKLATLGGAQPGGNIVVIRSGKPEPEDLPDEGVIITTDSLIAARPALRDRLVAWTPDVFIYDEAHRGKTFDSTRAQSQLKISVATVKGAFPVTGTPLFANPAELGPLLEFSGHLGPVFGGLTAYLDRYTKTDYFGNRVPYTAHLPELREKLRQHVWVRRRKRDVLPDLPQTLISPKWVDVNLAGYRRAYKDVVKRLTIWLEGIRKEIGGDPDEETIAAFASSQVGLVSSLRRAGGLAKVEPIVDDIRKHVEETTEIRDGKPYFSRPLIVWAHHIEVIDALAQSVPDAIAKAGVIRGGVKQTERDALVDAFQRNEVPVLVCSIVAAGVAITLTASSDSFFAESDWTPAMIRQALDRAERIGQTSDKILATTYLAAGTLDARVQEVLKKKSKVLDALYGEGNDVSVDVEKESIDSATEIVVGLIRDLMKGTKTP